MEVRMLIPVVFPWWLELQSCGWSCFNIARLDLAHYGRSCEWKIAQAAFLRIWIFSFSFHMLFFYGTKESNVFARIHCATCLWHRSLRWKNKPKHCSGWFVVREKHCSGWKKISWKRRIIREPNRACICNHNRGLMYLRCRMCEARSFPLLKKGYSYSSLTCTKIFLEINRCQICLWRPLQLHNGLDYKR